ncbi:HNH endonuclease [Rhizobium sp. RHZ02]|uniref:HNH endonuclease signature motif containing protein n=1 Tax=Rhizobium sp. RHZ02 TaxID=2769306 RepID=UPI00177DE6FA|nr:HNH endonuclease signature motif containing protein [Rhizobium sp. RHZ02]MBD9455922.1 HNH endonuclease [Rhizobium sp. RHZ02]
MSNFIPIEVLREKFLYEPDTGILYWRINNRGGLVSPPRPAGTHYLSGYLVVRTGGKGYPAHRICWALYYGEWPSETIDHINGVRDDNRIANLRDVTQSDNSKNMRLSSINKSGVSGVYWSSSKRKWVVQITHKRFQKQLGVFDSFDEAVSVRKAAELSWGYHENHGNRLRPSYSGNP